MCNKFGFQFRDLIYNWAKVFDHWLKIITKKKKPALKAGFFLNNA